MYVVILCFFFSHFVFILEVEAPELREGDHGVQVQGQVVHVQVHVPLPLRHAAQRDARLGEASIQVIQGVELVQEHVLQAGAQLYQGDGSGSGTEVGGQEVIL